MGLDFDVAGGYKGECARWGYSGFNRFRRAIASAAGINLDSMYGFNGSESWDKFKDEPLVPLLNHSDCDGELTPEECAKVAPRLKELLAKLPDTPAYDYDRCQGAHLVAMMEHSAKVGKPIIFC